MTAPKNSFFNVPLLIALLITSAIHVGLVFFWSKINLPTFEKKTHPPVIILIKLPLHKELKKTALAKPVQPKIEPTEKPSQSAVALKNSVTSEKPSTDSIKISKPQQHITPHQQRMATIIPVASVAVVEPTIPDVSVAEPAPPPTAETNAPEPVIAVVNEVTAIDKSVELPKKQREKSTKKSAEKPPQPESTSIDNAVSVLSMDDLSTQIAQVGEKFGSLPAEPVEKPPKKSSSSHKSKFLINQYTSDCRQKVQRIGNLNYPKSAWQKDYSARTVIEATINADGSIQSIRIKKSSEDTATDEAAKNIVQISAPFAVFPKVLAEERDELTIQFPLRFSDESGVTAQ